MYSKKTVVRNKTGLHARPASDLVMKALGYKSSVTIKKLDSDAKPINAKSIMHILAAAIKAGTMIEVSAQGEDEQFAVDQLVRFIETGLAG